MSEYQPTPKQEQALREYLHEAVVPLIEDVLVKKLGQAMAYLKEQQQPEQKPVAIVNEGMGGIEWLSKPLPDDTPLYTAPPKREWVGLTDEERERATGWSVEHIESYLKEKNT